MGVNFKNAIYLCMVAMATQTRVEYEMSVMPMILAILSMGHKNFVPGQNYKIS